MLFDRKEERGITCGEVFVLSQQIDPDWQLDVFGIITFGRSQKAAMIVSKQNPGQGCNFGCGDFVVGRIVVVVS